MIRFFRILLILFTLTYGAAFASIPVATDTRIKTLIYGENEVFQLNTSQEQRNPQTTNTNDNPLQAASQNENALIR